MSYEHEILRQETLPKSLYKLAIMPLSELKRYNRLASEKITIAKKDLGFFKGTHVKGVIWFGYDNQEQIHVICWSLDGLVSQGIFYVPNDKIDLDPLKILLNSLENFPEKLGEK